MLRQSADSVVFEHNGAPFTSVELAAILSGGSSEFNSRPMIPREPIEQ